LKTAAHIRYNSSASKQDDRLEDQSIEEAYPMRWQTGRRSDNVEDRRGMRPRGLMVGGGLGGLVLVVVLLLLGVNPQELLQVAPGNAGQPQSGIQTTNPAEDRLADFVAVVLADTEDVWREQFRQMGRTYQEPKLVLFSGNVQSACGFASNAVGPFYCPTDRKVYIDLDFYRELKERFGAPGDFAQAYVIAHEIGHHVQNLLGISEEVHTRQQRVSRAEANRLSVGLELQADFLAGVWAYHAQKMRNILEPGDIEEALGAANAIGDDRLQQETRGYVVPDSFTHGTSAQRVYWFRRGFETGDIRQGDTFSTRAP
jgi:predicted metalloprotease